MRISSALLSDKHNHAAKFANFHVSLLIAFLPWFVSATPYAYSKLWCFIVLPVGRYGHKYSKFKDGISLTTLAAISFRRYSSFLDPKPASKAGGRYQPDARDFPLRCFLVCPTAATRAIWRSYTLPPVSLRCGSRTLIPVTSWAMKRVPTPSFLFDLLFAFVGGIFEDPWMVFLKPGIGSPNIHPWFLRLGGTLLKLSVKSLEH